jgi:hypothetical protein
MWGGRASWTRIGSRARPTAIVLMSAFASACSDGRDPNADARAADPGTLDGGMSSAGHADGAGGNAGRGAARGDGAAGSGAADAGPALCPDVALDPPAPFSDERALHPVPPGQRAFFRIAIVAAGSRAPLGGAQLRTVNHVSLTSDEHGVIAFYEPGLMGREVYFDVSYPGYERAADSFGFRGVRLQVSEGGSAQVELTQVASAPAPAVTGDLQTRLAAGSVPGADACYALAITDRATGRGIPLVRVAIAGEEHWTDSNGLVAYCNPDRLGARMQVEASSHGHAPASASLELVAGGEGALALERLNVAERLYRVTGQGIYRDSLLLGRDVPLAEPALAGEVTGQDTVQTAIYQGKVFWVWGDTNRVSYPLGNFHTSSALSELPDQGGLPPSAGVDLDYFVDDSGFSKRMAPPETVPGSGVTWLGSLVAVPDAGGQERLFAGYALVASGTLMPTEIGIVRFDDAQQLFVKALALPSVTSRGPEGHPTRWLHAAGEHVYYLPPLRIPASAEAIVDPARYEVYTALARGSSDRFERSADGSLTYSWKTGTGYTTRAALDAAGIARDQALDGHLRDPDGGEAVTVHGGSSRTWNEYRRRFSEIVAQAGGSSSYLGELWYAEGDTPMGPWVYTRKVVTHDDYTFYNPRQHPFFDQQGGRRIYFEGSYVTTFASEAAQPTPRYDYNQVMYRLDLDDPRLVLPVPIYQRGEAPFELIAKHDVSPDDPALRASFFAPDRAAPGLIALAWSGAACNPRALVASEPQAAATPPVFYALPSSTPASERPAGAQALYAHRDGADPERIAYVPSNAAPAGYERDGDAIAYVWPSPLRVPFPVAEYLGDLVAVAGPDRCIAVPPGGNSAQVELDASGSRALRAPIARQLWTASSALGCAQVEAEAASFELPAGTHVVRLDVWDEAGKHDSDTLLVDVEP